MARIRSIKPEFFQHEDLGALSPLHRLVFIGLWTQADREGRLEDRPVRLKLAIAPYDDCDFHHLLDDLDAAEFIVRYEIDGVRYICIPKFGKHQRPHPKEAKSEIPPLPEEDTASREKVDTSREKDMASRVEALREISEGEDGGGGGNGGRTASPPPFTAHHQHPNQDPAPTGLATPSANPPGETQPDNGLSPLSRLWNLICTSLDPVLSMTDERRAYESARLAEHSLDQWELVFCRIEGSPFLCGKNARHWRASFDWIVNNPDHAVKVLEGKYVDPGFRRIPTRAEREAEDRKKTEAEARRRADQQEAERLAAVVNPFPLTADEARRDYWTRAELLRQRGCLVLPVIYPVDRQRGGVIQIPDEVHLLLPDAEDRLKKYRPDRLDTLRELDEEVQALVEGRYELLPA